MSEYCEGCSALSEEQIEKLGETGPIKLVSEITEFNDLHDFMEDEQVDRALDLVVKLYMKQDVPPAQALKLILELQALSTKFSMMGKIYETIKSGPPRSDAAHKKNLYKNMNASIDKLVDALKHVAKQGNY